MILCLIIVIVFKTSAALGNAYGMFPTACSRVAVEGLAWPALKSCMTSFDLVRRDEQVPTFDMPKTVPSTY